MKLKVIIFSIFLVGCLPSEKVNKANKNFGINGSDNSSLSVDELLKKYSPGSIVDLTRVDLLPAQSGENCVGWLERNGLLVDKIFVEETQKSGSDPLVTNEACIYKFSSNCLVRSQDQSVADDLVGQKECTSNTGTYKLFASLKQSSENHPTGNTDDSDSGDGATLPGDPGASAFTLTESEIIQRCDYNRFSISNCAQPKDIAICSPVSRHQSPPDYGMNNALCEYGSAINIAGEGENLKWQCLSPSGKVKTECFVREDETIKSSLSARIEIDSLVAAPNEDVSVKVILSGKNEKICHFVKFNSSNTTVIKENISETSEFTFTSSVEDSIQLRLICTETVPYQKHDWHFNLDSGLLIKTDKTQSVDVVSTPFVSEFIFTNEALPVSGKFSLTPIVENESVEKISVSWEAEHANFCKVFFLNETTGQFISDSEDLDNEMSNLSVPLPPLLKLGEFASVQVKCRKQSSDIYFPLSAGDTSNTVERVKKIAPPIGGKLSIVNDSLQYGKFEFSGGSIFPIHEDDPYADSISFIHTNRARYRFQIAEFLIEPVLNVENNDQCQVYYSYDDLPIERKYEARITLPSNAFTSPDLSRFGINIIPINTLTNNISNLVLRLYCRNNSYPSERLMSQLSINLLPAYPLGRSKSCGTGKYFSEGLKECVSYCGIDSYRPGPYSKNCLSVGNGFYSPAENDNRYLCSEKFGNLTIFTSSGKGSDNCSQMVAPRSSSNQTMCPAGQYLNANKICSPVNDGFWSPANSDAQLACPLPPGMQFVEKLRWIGSSFKSSEECRYTIDRCIDGYSLMKINHLERGKTLEFSTCLKRCAPSFFGSDLSQWNGDTTKNCSDAPYNTQSCVGGFSLAGNACLKVDGLKIQKIETPFFTAFPLTASIGNVNPVHAGKCFLKSLDSGLYLTDGQNQVLIASSQQKMEWFLDVDGNIKQVSSTGAIKSLISSNSRVKHIEIKEKEGCSFRVLTKDKDSSIVDPPNVEQGLSRVIP